MKIPSYVLPFDKNQDQCLQNFRAWIKNSNYMNIGPVQIVSVAKDRVFFTLLNTESYIHIDRALFDLTRESKFTRANPALHGDTAFLSYRENVPFGSAQFTFHRNFPDPDLIEWDIDLGNPGWGDIASTFLHGLELAIPTKTNPFWVRKIFLKRGWKYDEMGIVDA